METNYAAWVDEGQDDPQANGTLRAFFIFDHCLDTFSAADSLQLVDTLLKRGTKVKMLDMSGASSNWIENYSILGCELMNFECDADETPVFLKDRPDELELMMKKQTVRSDGPANVTDSELARIKGVEAL